MMQRVATDMPHKHFPMLEIEEIFLRATETWKYFDRLVESYHWHYLPSHFVAPEFFEVPEGKQKEKADQLTRGSLHLRGLATQDRRSIMIGLSDFMLERFLACRLERLDIFREGALQKHQTGGDFGGVLDAVLTTVPEADSIADGGPATLTQSYARLRLVHLANSRVGRYAFLDRQRWTVGYWPERLTLEPDDANWLDAVWERASVMRGGFLVFRGDKPKESNIHDELAKLAGLVVPPDERRVLVLADEALRFYHARKPFTERQPDTFNRSVLAHHFGGKPNTRTFTKVWEAFLRLLPADETLVLSEHGRRKSSLGPSPAPH